MSLPLANDQDDPRTISYIVREVPGRGYQKRVLISDAATGKPICQRIGKIPFAIPLTAADRFRRAKPLAENFRYGSKTCPTDCTGLASESPQVKNYPQITEDCLQLNIWIPEGATPSEGWPVFIYIFGGFLQVGSPNGEDPVNLYRQSSYRAIFVSFTYRLNAFGFLASKELLEENGMTGNVGFWDQRLAIEFVSAEIHRYGGNSKNLTIGGLSAGAYSVFHQLAYSLSLPVDKAHFKRVVMWSNGCGLQPKPISEGQPSFDRLLEAANISGRLSAKEKLARLRTMPWRDLVAAIKQVPENSFRAVSDGQFVRKSLFEELLSGAFAQKMKARGIKIMIGDCRDEITAYRKINPPNSFRELVTRLEIEFSRDMVRKVLNVYCPSERLPEGHSTWQDIFGRIYSDLQVHLTERGLVSALASVLPEDHIFRYRIETRAAMLDKIMPKKLGVTHGSDLCYWFMGHNFGMKDDLKPDEVELAREMVDALAAFIQNGQPNWGTKDVTKVRLLDAHGVRIAPDPWWERSLSDWRRIHSLDRQRL